MLFTLHRDGIAITSGQLYGSSKEQTLTIFGGENGLVINYFLDSTVPCRVLRFTATEIQTFD